MPRRLRQTEAPIKKACLQWLWANRIFAYRQNQGTMTFEATATTKRRHFKFASVDGISDIIGIYRGRYLAIETKAPGNRPTEAQAAFLQRVRDEGGYATWVTSVEELEAFIAHIEQEAVACK